MNLWPVEPFYPLKWRVGFEKHFDGITFYIIRLFVVFFNTINLQWIISTEDRAPSSFFFWVCDIKYVSLKKV